MLKIEKICHPPLTTVISEFSCPLSRLLAWLVSICTLTYTSYSCNQSNQWCRRRGCKRTRAKSLKIRAKSLKIRAKSLKIRAKSLKIQAKSLKIRAKSLKIWAKSMKMFAKYLKSGQTENTDKMAPDVIWFWKIGVHVGRITWRPFFGGHPKNDLCGRKYSHKELPENFSDTFGEIRARIFRTPKFCLLLHLWIEPLINCLVK